MQSPLRFWPERFCWSIELQKPVVVDGRSMPSAPRALLKRDEHQPMTAAASPTILCQVIAHRGTTRAALDAVLTSSQGVTATLVRYAISYGSWRRESVFQDFYYQVTGALP